MFTEQQEERINELIQTALRDKEAARLDKNTLEFFKTKPDVNNYIVSELYDEYEMFCKERGVRALGKHSFATSVNFYYDITSTVTTFRNKSVRIYRRK